MHITFESTNIVSNLRAITVQLMVNLKLLDRQCYSDL